MKLVRDIRDFSQMYHKCVLTIGNFDGMHRGHQVLLRELCKEGKVRGLPTVVMIFEPLPLELFAGKTAPARLMQLRDKLCYLAYYNIDCVLCIRFDHHFASIKAQNFISDLLVKSLGVLFLIVGEDFRFGAGRQGDFSLLQKASIKYKFNIISSTTFCEKGMKVSSTAIRKALSTDQLDLAENLLGHPFSISGRVVHGNLLGRTIGFPTANIPLYHQVSPVKGVYGVCVLGLDDKPLPGVANIGICPTVSGVKKLLEVHLLSPTMDLYGRHINVILRKKIRNEQLFASLDELKAQITRDKSTARDFLGL